jgi:hypothetical protein
MCSGGTELDHRFAVHRHGNLFAYIAGEGTQRLQGGLFAQESLVAAFSEIREGSGIDDGQPPSHSGVQFGQRKILPLHSRPEVAVQVSDDPLDLPLGLGPQHLAASGSESVVRGNRREPLG